MKNQTRLVVIHSCCTLEVVQEICIETGEILNTITET